MANVNGKKQNTGSLKGRVFAPDTICGKSAWIAFSESSDGTDFTQTWSEGQTYMGVAVAETQPTEKESYTWVRIQGNQGPEGPQGRSMTYPREYVDTWEAYSESVLLDPNKEYFIDLSVDKKYEVTELYMDMIRGSNEEDFYATEWVFHIKFGDAKVTVIFEEADSLGLFTGEIDQIDWLHGVAPSFLPNTTTEVHLWNENWEDGENHWKGVFL